MEHPKYRNATPTGTGQDVPRIVPEPGGAIARSGGDQFALSAPVPLSVEDGTAYARLQLEAGQRVGFALQYAPAQQPAKFWTQREIQAGLEDTIEGWRSWYAVAGAAAKILDEPINQLGKWIGSSAALR